MNGKELTALLLLPMLLVACRSRKSAEELGAWRRDFKVHTNLSAGWRAVDHADYDEHAVVGIELETYQPEQVIGYELGFSFATDSADFAARSEDADFYEGYAGLRKTWGAPDTRLHPYLGLGGTYLVADREIDAGGALRSGHDTGAGGYGRAGLYWVLGTSDLDGGTEFTLGVDLRAVVAQDLDFVQAVVFFGFGR